MHLTVLTVFILMVIAAVRSQIKADTNPICNATHKTEELMKIGQMEIGNKPID